MSILPKGANDITLTAQLITAVRVCNVVFDALP